MEPTSEERREVAARLRELAEGKSPMAECSVDDLYIALGLPRSCAGIEYAVIGYLADIIYPTCHAEQDYDCDEPVQGRWWRCGACGERFTYDRGLSPRFCPECGARLVDE